MYRIFPISHNYYLSKLIFSPDASKPSRILVGKEVYNAEEYSTCVAPLRRNWPSPLLRFSIFDETPHKVPGSTAENSRETPSPLPFMAIPPPPVVMPPTNMPFPPPRIPSFDTQAAHDFLSFNSTHPPLLSQSRPLPRFEYPSSPPVLPSFSPPPPIIFPSPPSLPNLSPILPQATSPQSCCSVAKGKSEMETLLTSFKKDLDRIMRNTFGSEYNPTAEVDTSDRQTPIVSTLSTAACPATSQASYNPTYVSTEAPSLHWCFICRNECSGGWYGCVKCPWHIIVRILFCPKSCALLIYLPVSKLCLAIGCYTHVELWTDSRCPTAWIRCNCAFNCRYTTSRGSSRSHAVYKTFANYWCQA